MHFRFLQLRRLIALFALLAAPTLQATPSAALAGPAANSGLDSEASG